MRFSPSYLLLQQEIPLSQFSGLVTVLTLGCGAGIQFVGKLIDTRESARASVVAMAIITVGVTIGAVAASDLKFGSEFSRPC